MPEKLVRCPKCGRLLPELPPYSVYCCGGCGGFLRAQKKSPVSDDVSANTSEEKSPSEGVDKHGGIVRVEHDSERRTPVRVRFRDSARKSPLRETNSDDLDDHRNSPIRGMVLGGFGVQSKSPGRSADGDDRKSPLREERGDGRGKSPAFSVRGGVRKAPVIGGDDRRSEMRENLVVDNEEIEARDRLESIDESCTDRLRCEAMADRTVVSKLSVSPRRRRAWHRDDPPMGFGLELRAEQVGRRADGTVKEYGNMYGRRHAEVSYDDWVDEGDDGVARGIGGSRAQDEYLGVFGKPRKRMEQLRDERIWSDGVQEDGKVLGVHRRVPVNYRAELLCKYNALREQLIRVGDLISYNGQGDQGISSTDCYGGQDDYVYDEFSRARRGTVRSAGLNRSNRTRPHYISGSRVPSEFPFHVNPSLSQFPGRTIHHQPPYYHEQFATQQSMDSTYDPRRTNVHHPACSCSHCHNGNLQAHTRAPAAAFGHKRSPNNLSSHQRSSVDSKSDEGSSAHEHGNRELVGNQKWQPCHPIAGGAPFAICYSCFQLLRLPGKLTAAKKKQFRLQCGSCHTILSLEFNIKRSYASDQTPAKPNSADACDGPCEVVTKSHHNIRKSKSYEFIGNDYPFRYTDSEPSSELEDQRLISAEAAKRSGSSATSSQALKDDHFSETTVDQNDASNEAEKPLANVLHPLRPPPGSPLQDRMESDALNQDKGTAQSKLELYSGETPKTDTSQGSEETSITKGQGGFSEASELSFATFSLNTSLSKADVFVNGKSITPYAARVAEKMAGPISPGEYWYDSRAGFWGVMGGHCLGIIPPCIEEFSSQMPANCSGGNTCIYVNGRELHENDLDMLSIRGFPRTSYRYYLVDISGKVQDERTGGVVLNLGKLAPTVESTGCGFGMQPPGAHNG